jgi:hypothetical protein
MEAGCVGGAIYLQYTIPSAALLFMDTIGTRHSSA